MTPSYTDQESCVCAPLRLKLSETNHNGAQSITRVAGFVERARRTLPRFDLVPECPRPEFPASVPASDASAAGRHNLFQRLRRPFARLRQETSSENMVAVIVLSESSVHKPAKVARTKMSTNAVAGAAAGIMVSLCLHPIDTLKVVIQSEASSNRSLSVVLSRVISRGGVLGLYSGIAANLAASAPISAIYTASYEAVKENLTPRMPEGCTWIAHSAAGGCASVATSFLYTPSECVKQQMQVGTYRTTANAIRGIALKQGPLGFYKGWTAVLARNIPHSAVKFFAFEQLKQLACASNGNGCTQATPAQTVSTTQFLFCSNPHLPKAGTAIHFIKMIL
ncbi:hypothetical protein CYMTET_22645 [Cymbomonas tetramitiformis]|uniref:Mitochondrial carrier protein n=1 Tax=Cymbomonas tetramitiformis TaxID=36881 RepID=A0AAE0G0C4_9CHLO|nr:hypothetical protein CYMTET_22645 [Cymbomonas tetramitiformis]